jgi:hypothetical protein
MAVWIGGVIKKKFTTRCETHEHKKGNEKIRIMTKIFYVV